MRDRYGCGPDAPGAAFFAGRRGGGRRRGRFGRGWGGGGGGGFLRAGRMLADGDLRLIALRLLEDGPRHGYDIIRALEDLSSGVYAPSPGVVYPTLTFLEEAGYATSAPDGAKKVYSITPSGRAHLEDNREIVESVLAEIERFGAKMARAREWFDWLGDDEDRAPRRRPRDVSESAERLMAMRRRLRRAVDDIVEAPEDVQERAADILARAAEELDRLE